MKQEVMFHGFVSLAIKLPTLHVEKQGPESISVNIMCCNIPSMRTRKERTQGYGNCQEQAASFEKTFKTCLPIGTIASKILIFFIRTSFACFFFFLKRKERSALQQNKRKRRSKTARVDDPRCNSFWERNSEFWKPLALHQWMAFLLGSHLMGGGCFWYLRTLEHAVRRGFPAREQVWFQWNENKQTF